jgi:hypothetical protein
MIIERNDRDTASRPDFTIRAIVSPRRSATSLEGLEVVAERREPAVLDVLRPPLVRGLVEGSWNQATCRSASIGSPIVQPLLTDSFPMEQAAKRSDPG